MADQWPVDRWRGLGVVVGCSGGADSVALVSALAALRGQIREQLVPGRTEAEIRDFMVQRYGDFVL